MQAGLEHVDVVVLGQVDVVGASEPVQQDDFAHVHLVKEPAVVLESKLLSFSHSQELRVKVLNRLLIGCRRVGNQ